MKLEISKTINTPQIIFENGVFVISGRSIPENAVRFFEPVFKFIADYSKSPKDQTIVNIKLEYANSSTNRSLMTIFTLLEKIHENGSTLIVNWYYEIDDELMLDLGTDFQSMLRMPFKFYEQESLN